MKALGPIDNLLVQTLRGPTVWPDGMNPDSVHDRAVYQGVAALLSGDHLAGWPAPVLIRLRDTALAQAMWEIRHRLVLTRLLGQLDEVGIRSVLLKGSALAYRYYINPSARARSDTDLLVAAGDLARARGVLTDQGYAPCHDPDTGSGDHGQESWSLQVPDGGTHEIDLHWSVLNSPVLDTALPAGMALAAAVPLGVLGRGAWVLPLHLALLHACLHRSKHVTSPYFVDQMIHFGGDRLIWLIDIDLMLRAMTPDDMMTFESAAALGGVGRICGQALAAANGLLGTPVPAGLTERLHYMPQGPAGSYLGQSHQAGRVLQDLAAVQGLAGKARYLARRLFPPAAMLRARYPDRSGWPLPGLYLLRLVDFWRPRGAKTR